MTTSTIKSAIEMHDSVLAEIDSVGGTTKIVLRPAYIHKTVGVPGVDCGTGWAQDVIFSVESGSTDGQPSELPCDISDGELLINDEQLENILVLPLDRRGRIELSLLLKSNERIVIRGSHITAELLGSPEYVEDFAGIEPR